jgi:hypothetical protein
MFLIVTGPLISRLSDVHQCTSRQVARKSMYPYKMGTPDVFEWSTIYISALCRLQPFMPLFLPGLQSDNVLPPVSLCGNEYLLSAMLATHTLRKRVCFSKNSIYIISLSYLLPGQGMNASMNDSHNLGEC